MALSLRTPPASEPVTLAEVREQARVSAAAEDTYLNALIPVARQVVETRLRRALITSTWLQTFPSLIPGALCLYNPPLQSVVGVTYVDTDGATQTLAADTYNVDTLSTPGMVLRKDGATWPSVLRRGVPAPVTVEFVAGYGDSREDVPEAVRHAILLVAAHLYENRHTVDGRALPPMPMAVDALLGTEAPGVYP